MSDMRSRFVEYLNVAVDRDESCMIRNKEEKCIDPHSLEVEERFWSLAAFEARGSSGSFVHY